MSRCCGVSDRQEKGASMIDLNGPEFLSMVLMLVLIGAVVPLVRRVVIRRAPRA